jgi:predicted anti-sigma-YlaC factor YlaD
MSVAAAVDVTCRRLTEVITDYLEGKMSLLDRVKTEQHLHMCPGCAIYLAQMKNTVALAAELKAAAQHAPSARVQASLVNVFRGWKAGPK